MHVYPLIRTQRHIRVDAIRVSVLDDVYIHDAEAIARAQNRTCILRLKDVFECDGHIPCSLLQHIIKTTVAFFRDA